MGFRVRLFLFFRSGFLFSDSLSLEDFFYGRAVFLFLGFAVVRS